MSESPGRRSLAPIGAEDDGDSGTKSVPAMLRLVKDCLVRHTQCVTDTVSAVADADTLSTARAKRQHAQLVEFDDNTEAF